MKCYVHPETDAVGTCVRCGKFICETCNTELAGKNCCKKCIADEMQERERKLEKAESKSSANNPMVFMNAGGGGGGNSGNQRVPKYPTNSILIHLILACVTFGVGNIIYFLYVKAKQRERNNLYRQ